MVTDERRNPQREDELFQRLLAPTGAPPPSAEQLERWTKLFAARLHAARRRRFTRRLAAGAVAAAAAVVLGVVLAPTRAPPAPGAAVARVVTAFGGNVVREEGDVRRVLEAGAEIAAGDLVQSGLRSGLGVAYRAADVRLNGTTSVIFHPDRLELRRGSVYVDVPEAALSPGSGDVLVETPLGTFAHRGTQFVVTVSDVEVSGAVREGTIVLRNARGELRLAAPPNRARRVVIDRSGDLLESEVPASGALWAWALRASPGIVVSGRSVDDVLRWVTRERGQRLVYGGDAAERLAREVRLAGGAVEMSAEEAVATVDRATRLRIDASRADVLRVTLSSEGDQDAH